MAAEEEELKQLLTQHRLQEFTEKFIRIGVTCRVDLENVESQNLTEMGMSQIQKNRFRKMVTSLGLRRWDSTESMASVSSLMEPSGSFLPQRLLQPSASYLPGRLLQPSGSSLPRERPRFCLQASDYTLNYIVLQHIDCIQVKSIPNLDPDITTIEALKETILTKEKLQRSLITCELFTNTGVPLSNDPYMATWSLNQRCIKTNSMICVILRDPNIGHSQGYRMWDDTMRPDQGVEYIYCETSHGKSYKVQVNLEKDTPEDVKKKITCQASIPDCVQHLRLPGASSFAMNCNNTLQNNGIKQGDTILIDIQSIDQSTTDKGWRETFNCDVKPHVQQTPMGMSTFACFLYVMFERLDTSCLRLIRELTNWPPLLVALKKLADKRTIIFCEQVAIVEGLYFLFRRILPSNEVQDNKVFEHSALCWAYLLKEKPKESNSSKEFKEISFNCSHCYTRLFLPVIVPGLQPEEVMCVHDFEMNDSVGISDNNEVLRCSADLEIQKLLLCYPLEAKSCLVWDIPSNVTSRLRNIPRKSLGDLRRFQGKFDRLKIKTPLQLKGGCTSVPLVTLNALGLPVVFSDLCKSAAAAYPLRLYDPVTKTTETEDADTLAESTKKYFSTTDDVTGSDCLFTRPPKEAIVMAVDISLSMKSKSFARNRSDQSRLSVVQQMFCTFADRSMAYNFQHVIGLVTFNSTPSVTGKLTEFFVEFKAKLEKMDASGNTALYDGISTAIDQFEEIKKLFPDCKRRIICLSDGEDNKSTSAPLTIAKKLQSQKIILDAVDIGTKQVQTIKGLCSASGGYCFRPINIVEASKIFELETMLSLTAREERSHQQVKNLSDLQRLSTKPYDDHPKRRLPAEVKDPVTSTDSSIQVAAKKGQSAMATRSSVYRVMQEMTKIHRKPHPAFKILPAENNAFFWRIFMTGPTGTPYENGVFSLFAEFPDNYPAVPPVVRFITPIHHCNINSVGRICHSIFDRDYSSGINIYKILSAIYGLLMTPEPDDPLDTVVAEEYLMDPTGYNTKAQEMTRKHAAKPLAECIQDIMGSSADNSSRPPPKHLICPLTGQIFVEPVETPGGYAYERLAIELHLQTHGTDPQSKEPLTVGELQDATALRKAADDFRASQTKVTAWWFNR
ncbi:uncharacterized protein [Amphiura filiformis]|uniref:uncharacterized protein n=1 Tax=Amphiura filiformis TaxID=82378 RepID=UPI003B220AFB